MGAPTVSRNLEAMEERASQSRALLDTAIGKLFGGAWLTADPIRIVKGRKRVLHALAMERGCPYGRLPSCLVYSRELAAT